MKTKYTAHTGDTTNYDATDYVEGLEKQVADLQEAVKQAASLLNLERDDEAYAVLMRAIDAKEVLNG